MLPNISIYIWEHFFILSKEMRKLAIEKNVNSRIQHKHDTEANWNKATKFIPKQGEFIIYDVDDNYSYERVKVGDGITPVTNLPFYLATEIQALEEKLEVLNNMLDVEIDKNLHTLIFTRPLSI